MADRDEAARLISEAQEATSSGDHRAAERALRLALRLQEEQFGLVHPEVVGTLDSLGVVCGLLGRPDEAEYLHRRALGIAKKTLGADHPSVAASLRNLSNLYAAQGKPGRLQVVAGGRLESLCLLRLMQKASNCGSHSIVAGLLSPRSQWHPNRSLPRSQTLEADRRSFLPSGAVERPLLSPARALCCRYSGS